MVDAANRERLAVLRGIEFDAETWAVAELKYRFERIGYCVLGRCLGGAEIADLSQLSGGHEQAAERGHARVGDGANH